MNSDIRIALSFKGHRKRKKLARRLEISEAATGGHLLDLWLTVAMECPDGILKGWDKQDIADAASWSGDTETLVSALRDRKASWLRWDRNNRCYILHDWEENQPWASKAKERSESARHAANAKHKQTVRDASVAQCDEQSIAQDLARLDGMPLSLPILSYPDPDPSPIPISEITGRDTVPPEGASRSPSISNDEPPKSPSRGGHGRRSRRNQELSPDGYLEKYG